MELLDNNSASIIFEIEFHFCILNGKVLFSYYRLYSPSLSLISRTIPFARAP